jgi:acyl-CoA thioesterase FadM
VADLGRTSVSYELDLVRGSDRVASGKMIAVFIDRETGAKREWPEVIRSALSGSSDSRN